LKNVSRPCSNLELKDVHEYHISGAPSINLCSNSESESFEERDSEISDEGEDEPEDGKSLGSDDSEDSDEDGGMSEYSDESIVFESEEDELDRLEVLAEQVHHAEKRRRVK
jgi:hypothetical protein